MRWILFFQTPYDRVKFRTDEMEETVSKTYYKFKDYLFQNFYVLDSKGILDALDSFQTVLLEKDSGKWETISPNYDKEGITFEELFSINNKNKETPETKDESLVKYGKATISNIWNKKKKKFRW